MQLLVRLWPWVLALLVLFPVLAPGYTLSYDMVFVPDLALRPDFFGLGSSLPRAVPSDAVVATVDEVLPGMLLQKIVLVGALVLAGTGARRLVPRDQGVAQLAASSFYVWNPYVAERLVLGHWPLLLAYAALPWVVDAARRLRVTGEGWPALVLWLALGALSASGGVMTAVAAIAFSLGRGRPAVRRTLAVAGLVVVLNAPWWVAGVLHPSGGLSDPAGVRAFAASAEGLLPVPLSLLGLGGIWNVEVVPVTRLGWAAVVFLVLTTGTMLVGLRRWLHWNPRRDAVGFAACAGIALGVALLGAWGAGAMVWLVDAVPGFGLFRDGARFLGLLALAEAGLVGAGAAVLATAVTERVARVALAVGVVLMPLAFMPDLAVGAAGRLATVSFPADYAAARASLAEAARREPGTGDVLVLPFTSYRAPEWNDGRRTLDPLGRYLTEDYVASDDLFVSGRLIRGEDPRARRVAVLLRTQSGEQLGRSLAAEGVAWVARDRDAQAALDDRRTPPRLDELSLVHDGEQVRVWRTAAEVADPQTSGGRLAATLVAWLAATVTVVAAGASAAASALGRRRRTTAPDVSHGRFDNHK
jgi:hypothetical protein